MESQKNTILSYLLLVLAPLLWAGNFFIGRVMHTAIPPFTLAFFRWLLVIIILLPWNIKKLPKHIDTIKKHWLIIVTLSILSITIYTAFIYLGLHYTNILNAALINSSVPVFIVLLSFFIMNENSSPAKITGIACSLIGVIFILTKGNVESVFYLHYSRGDFIILTAAIAWALFSVLFKKLPKEMPPLLFLFITAVIGDLILLPGFLIEHQMGLIMEYHWASFFSIMYAAIFASILAFTFWNMGLRSVGPNIAAHFFNLLPVFAAAFGILFLKEKIHVYHLIGLLFVFSGIYLATKQKRHHPKGEEPSTRFS